MKKIFFMLGLTSVALLSKPYTQEDRIKDMQEMAKYMLKIQNGFFYNNFDMIKLGGVKVADAIERVEPPLSEKEEKDVMTRFMNGKVKMTNKIKNSIKRKIEHMIERFSKGDKTQALQYYMGVTRECMKCHTKLRKW